jgi:hypothetical protein
MFKTGSLQTRLNMSLLTVSSNINEGVLSVDATAQRYRFYQLTPVLETLRHLAQKRPDTSFLISKTDVPQSLQKYVSEDVAVVVPLLATCDEPWIFHGSDCSAIFREIVVTDGDAPSISIMLAFDQGRILIDYNVLAGNVIPRLRTTLPVLYISAETSVLVTYPFQAARYDAAFHAAVEDFHSAWEASSESFEQRLRRLQRDNLPRHVLVTRNIAVVSR